jgi:uncharacterized membrane protein YqiK
MNPEILFCIIAVLALIGIVAIVAWLILRYLLKPERLQAELERQRAQNIDPFESPIASEELRATVIDHTCQVQMVGTKTPKATKIFTVVFRTEEEKILSLNVPEEMYDGFEIGQNGLLTLVDGELYGFAPEE